LHGLIREQAVNSHSCSVWLHHDRHRRPH